MNTPLRKWLQVSLFNLLLVALIGVLLRYKIAFSLPFVDQKYLLHGHSHFAFAGWLTQALMALLVSCLPDSKNYFNRYRWILYANLLTAYGMLFTFPFVGYNSISIFFSTLSVFVSYAFAYMYLRDIKTIKDKTITHAWFAIAVLCNAISSAGPFSLAYMMATHHIQQNWYLASIYFFLHFQYNGWFFFACMGLLSTQMMRLNLPVIFFKKVFVLFTSALIPAYFLSVLWWPIPVWLYIIVVIASVCQLLAWWILLKSVTRQYLLIKFKFSLLSRIFFLLSALACTIKLCLQAVSVLPAISKIAFGFRPIVIGYLHLVLLGIVTIFIIAYMVTYSLININKTVLAGFIIFIAGIFINEFFLMVQGIAGIGYAGIPHIEIFLLASAIVLCGGMLIVNYAQINFKDDPSHKMPPNKAVIL